MNTNLVLPACDPRADAGFLIMESEEYALMSGANIICTATVLLETGVIPMKEPRTEVALDTAAGLVAVTAECEAGTCIQQCPRFCLWTRFQSPSSQLFQGDFG